MGTLVYVYTHLLEKGQNKRGQEPHSSSGCHIYILKKSHIPRLKHSNVSLFLVGFAVPSYLWSHRPVSLGRLYTAWLKKHLDDNQHTHSTVAVYRTWAMQTGGGDGGLLRRELHKSTVAA